MIKWVRFLKEPMPFTDQAINILRENDYKITGPRMAVIGVLSKAEIPLSANPAGIRNYP